MTASVQDVSSVLGGSPVWRSLTPSIEVGPIIKPLAKQIVLVQGWPGSGKSRLVHSLPKCLILDTERGSSEFPMVHPDSARMPIRTYDDLAKVQTALVEDVKSGRPMFDTVAIDTLDSLGGNPNSIIGTHIMNKAGVNVMADVGANGKGYGDMATLANRFLQLIIESGYGVWMTCHLRRQQIHEWQGLKQVTKLSTTRDLTNGLEAYAKKMCGYCWTAEHLLNMEPKTVQRSIRGKTETVATGDLVPVDVYRLLDRTEPGRQELTKARRMRLPGGGLSFDVTNGYELLKKTYEEQLTNSR